MTSFLNPNQIRAIQHRDGPLLVVAGAGSGKTSVVTYRIAHLIELGIAPSSILAVTFTNKAAGEMLERVAKLLKEKRLSSHPTICTFHSLGAQILRQSIHHLGYQSNFTIFDEEDSNKLLKSCIQSLQIKGDTSHFKLLRNLISQAKNQLASANDLPMEDLPRQFQLVLPELYSLYQERLKANNALDFDDLLYLTVRLFQQYPDVLALYQEKWPFLLIDEYQDTNHVQYTLARLIAGKKRNIFVVGDPDQSIYSWRGANIRNILNFERDYPGATVIRLEQNYRSRKNILDAANALIRHNAGRIEKNLWSDKPEGEKIHLFVADTEREEAGFVLNAIEQLHTLKMIPYKEMAIFYRTNFQSRIFEDFLLRKNIPYVIVGGISFYQRREIKDLLAFLRMVKSDTDWISFERTINLPKRGFGESTLEKIRLGAMERQCGLIEYCRQFIDADVRLNARQKAGLQDYITLIERLRSLQTSLQKLLIETIRESHYLDVLREDKETFEDRKANVDELVTKAYEWEMLNDSNSLEKFLEELSLKTTLDEADFHDDKINLMTIHNGKGLEFTITFLVGMEEDLFPHANSRDRIDALEEERRLCYVGMTRAKEGLYLTAAKFRFIWGTHRSMRPSRFLREIPRQYLDKFA